MHKIQAITLLVATSIAVPAGSAELQSNRYLTVTNATFDSISAVAIGPDGSYVDEPIDIGAPLQGGGISITIDVPPGGCLREVRMTFEDGRTAHIPHVNICRSDRLRVANRKSE